jgi:uncharacterized protein YggU (UPF0235/DUF167 family)
MTATPIRFVTSSVKSVYGSIHLRCRVKPGASRQCILAISETQVDVCVTGQAKDNEANKAVRELISEVSIEQQLQILTHIHQILNIPKSDIEVAKGLKSRDKIVVIGGINPEGDEDGCIARIRGKIQDSIE